MTLPTISPPITGSSINLLYREGGWMVTANTLDASGNDVVGQFIATEAEAAELSQAISRWIGAAPKRPA